MNYKVTIQVEMTGMAIKEEFLIQDASSCENAMMQGQGRFFQMHGGVEQGSAIRISCEPEDAAQKLEDKIIGMASNFGS